MASRHSNLAGLGWNDWFEQRAQCGPSVSLARVAAVDRGWLVLMDQTGTFRAKLAGSYRHHHRLTQDLPCVGDWVGVERQAPDACGVVHELLERRTALRRKAAGEAGQSQMIAANLDEVIVVQSCHYDFNLKRLQRYLVMIQEGGAAASVLLTKTDLVAPELLVSQVAQIRAVAVTVPVLGVSNRTGTGLDQLKRRLLPAQTYCFVGSSGVGKSTLINQLIGHEQLLTQCVSETGRGRHTTVRRELIRLAGGALVIDNPGMREFGLVEAENGMSDRFADLIGLATACHYRNCRHTGEPGCAVREALEAGTFGQDHYDHYLKLKKEAEFSQLSYGQKRKKDRDFGRFIKSAKKDLER